MFLKTPSCGALPQIFPVLEESALSLKFASADKQVGDGREVSNALVMCRQYRSRQLGKVLFENICDEKGSGLW